MRENSSTNCVHTPLLLQLCHSVAYCAVELNHIWTSVEEGNKQTESEVTDTNAPDLHSCFKISLKRFLCHHSFYTIKEYYEYNENKYT